MRAHMPNRSELARGRPAPEEWARIDPMIYVTAARRLQAQATAEAIGAGWRAVRRGLIGLAGLARRHLLEPLARRCSAPARARRSRGAWTTGCSPTSGCGAATSSWRSPGAWPIRG